MQKQTQLVFSTLAYVVGAALGLFLVVIGTWADMEAASYGFPRVAEAGLRGLACPVLMTRHEVGELTLTLTNSTSTKVSPAVKVLVSTPALPEEFRDNLELLPGETKKLRWRVDVDNIDLGSFIFAKALMYSAYPLTSREVTCGIFILDWPGRGNVLVAVLVALSLSGMAWGLMSWRRFYRSDNWTTKNWRALAALALMLVTAFVLSVLGNWIPAVLVLAMILLTLIILLGPLLLGERRPR